MAIGEQIYDVKCVFGKPIVAWGVLVENLAQRERICLTSLRMLDHQVANKVGTQPVCCRIS